MKKNVLIILGAAVTALLAGCSTTPVALAPVGPNPAGVQTASTQGQLEVFSALSGRREGNNPTWYQHTDYSVYNYQGKKLEHVWNTTGYYEQTPRTIALPVGKYIVEARANNVLQARVPVLIKPGEITRVHLDGHWQPPSDTPQTEVVRAPGGYPVGWHAE
jgi:hypothetical protein